MNKPYKIGKSNIEGQGLIAATDLKPGDLIGLSHSGGEIASEIGQYYNHSDTPNAVSALVGNDRYLIASDNISMGGEITVNYRLQPELEQPEDFMVKAQDGGSPIHSFEESIIDSIGFDRDEGMEYAYDILDRKYKQKYLDEWNNFSKEEKDKWKKSKAFEYAKANMDSMGIPWEEQSDAENYWTSWKIDNHIFDDYNHAIQSYLLAKKIGPTKATMYSAAHEGSNLFEGIKHTFKGDFGAIPQISGDSATDMRNNLIGINAFKEGLSIDELLKILEDDGAYREKFDGIYKDRSWSDLFSDIFYPKRMQGGGATVLKPVINFSKKLLKKVTKDNRYLPMTKWQNVLNKNFNTGEQLLLTRALENNPNLVQNSMIDLKALETFVNYDLEKSLPRFTPVTVNTDDAGMLTSNWKSQEAGDADFGAHRLPNLMSSQFKYAGYQGGNTFRMPGTNRFTPLNYSFAMPQLFTDPRLPAHHDGLHLIDDKAIGWFRGLSDAQNPNRYIAQEFQMDLGKDRQNTYLAEKLDMDKSLGLSGRLENQKINYAEMLKNIEKRTSHDVRTLNDLNSNLSIKQAEYNNKYGLEEYANEIPTLENEIAYIQNRIRELNKKIGEGNIELVTQRIKSITDPLQASRIMESPYMTLHNESLNFLRNKGFDELVIPDAKTITNIQNWPSPKQGTLDLYTRLRNNPMLQQGDPFKFDEYQGTIFKILDKPYKRFKQEGGEEKKMFDWKGYFSGEQGIIPDLYGESTKETYVENKDNIQNVLDVVSASNVPVASQFATLGSLTMDLGDAYSAYKEGDIDTAKDELTSAATNTALKLSGLGAAKFLNKNTKNVVENIAQGVVNTAGRYGTKKTVNSGVQEAVDSITNTNQSNVGDIAQSPDLNTMAMMGGEVYRYERSPFKDGKFVISNPADLIIEMTKTEIFTPEFKMGGVVTADGFTLEKMFDNKRKLPFVQYSGEPDIEGRIYYDDTTNEIVDVTTLELKKKRKHNRIKTIIEKYESGKDLSGVEIDALNSLGLLD